MVNDNSIWTSYVQKTLIQLFETPKDFEFSKWNSLEILGSSFITLPRISISPWGMLKFFPYLGFFLIYFPYLAPNLGCESKDRFIRNCLNNNINTKKHGIN
jgi:hypothetical protein